MKPLSDQHIAQVGEEILWYLQAHPNAADSLMGITHWWLPRQRYEEALNIIRQALDYLVKQQRIDQRVLPDGKVLYAKSRVDNSH